MRRVGRKLLDDGGLVAQQQQGLIPIQPHTHTNTHNTHNTRARFMFFLHDVRPDTPSTARHTTQAEALSVCAVVVVVVVVVVARDSLFFCPVCNTVKQQLHRTLLRTAESRRRRHRSRHSRRSAVQCRPRSPNRLGAACWQSDTGHTHEWHTRDTRTGNKSEKARGVQRFMVQCRILRG